MLSAFFLILFSFSSTILWDFYRSNRSVLIVVLHFLFDISLVIIGFSNVLSAVLFFKNSLVFFTFHEVFFSALTS